jgi:ATPase subunit of ABC transporter with duplicated ATPase domains
LSTKYDEIFNRETKERQEYQKAFDERQKAYEEQQKAKEEQREKQRKADEEQRKADEKQRKAKEEQRDAKYEQEKEERRKDDERRTKEFEKIVSETNRTLNETSRTFNETSRNLNSQMGELGNRFGELAEHLVAPGIEARLNELGYHFEGVTTNFKVKKDGRVLAEVDLLLENAETIAIVEVKSKPDQKDIEKHIERMAIVRNFFDSHRHDSKDLIGAVAGAIFPDNVKKFTIETGFYAITQSGDTLKIDVPEGFKPRIF